MEPSGIVDDALIEKGVRNLESFGLRVKLAPNIRAVLGGYAGTVNQRLADLHGMFLDREVEGLWVLRGGSGGGHLLPHLDYELIRSHPKAFVGYSDTTSLHLGLLRGAGLVTFHGPVASSTFSEYSAGNLRAVLMEPRATRAFEGAKENAEKALQQKQFAPLTFRTGTAEGPLVGGNLAVLSSLIGTPFAPRTKGCVLFLEEISEAPYRVDRLLEQLRQSGVLTAASGVALGVFQKCDPPDSDPSLTLAEVLEAQFRDSKVPAAYGFSFGHIAHQMTLPLGIRARMDAAERTLTLLEPAVA
ncbi:putative murein peptide carboxypeptidase [Usitatibacter rugosus]|uniref:Putative murein peptide carboxypeptidase n=1 Tax=Usitatibacter rugosus TaxID=2732067 RepID=A0A6M4GUE2_9PROT|nr:LD-carboxypeptidase [Usitatibacter rugosus]QJR10468.1 putative murein peptide carboxypeptidase [Usitatibacter rugosus]